MITPRSPPAVSAPGTLTPTRWRAVWFPGSSPAESCWTWTGTAAASTSSGPGPAGVSPGGGSQGQKRTSVLTLKLCELEIVKEEIEDTPVLLLDDFMSELDDKRRERFLENIEGNQVILTGTNKIDIKNDSSIFYIENGIIKVEK